jgi:hypothetical protein
MLLRVGENKGVIIALLHYFMQKNSRKKST